MIKVLLIILLSSTCLLNASASKFGLTTTKGEPLELLELKTKALVEGPYAEVQYIHTYKNPLDHAVETKFHFPRTDSSIFHKFEAVFQNQTIVGKIMEKQTAKRMYEWNTRRGNTVAYSERSQSAPDVMNIKVGNIPANETVEIIFSVIQPLETIINKFYELKLPVVLTERYTPTHHHYHHDTPNIQTVNAKGSLYKEWNIQVELKSNSPFAILTNPSHLLKPKLSEQSSGSNSKIYKAIWNVAVVPNRDFVVYFGPEKLEKPETILATYPQDLNNHVLLMNFIPDLNTVDAKIAQQLLETDDGLLRLKKMAFEYDIEHAQAEFIFVIDRSGSMIGRRIENLKKALAKFLNTIPKTSYFNIISFGSSYELYRHQSVLNSPQALKEALKWVETIQADMGGTEILESLKYITHSLKQVADVPKIVMILTDGDVFNPDEVINHISTNANKMRFCSVGIGSGASDYLVRNMAKAGKCRSEFVQEHEDIGDKALYMVQAAISQYITDVRFDITCFNDQNQKVYSDKAELDLLLKDQSFSKWIYLENIANLKSCQATLAYYSSLKSKRVMEEMDIQRYELEEITNFWHKVAYDAKIKELEHTVKKGRNWNQENMKNQIIELSTKYQVLSDYTSFLAVIQESTVNPNESAQQISIPNMKSADYSTNHAELEKTAKVETFEREESENELAEADITLPDDTFAGANIAGGVQFSVDANVDVEVQVFMQVDVDYDGCSETSLDVDISVDSYDEPDYDLTGGYTTMNMNTDIEVTNDLPVNLDDDGTLDGADVNFGIDMLAKVDVEVDLDVSTHRANSREVQYMTNVDLAYPERADGHTEANIDISVDIEATEADLHVNLIKDQEEEVEEDQNEAEDEDSKANIEAQNVDTTQIGCGNVDDSIAKECSGEQIKEEELEKQQVKEEAHHNKLTESPDLKFMNTTNHSNLTQPVQVLTQISDEKEPESLKESVNVTLKNSFADHSYLKFTSVSLIFMLLSVLFF